MKGANFIWIALLGVGLLLLGDTGSFLQTATAATYVYEKDTTAVPTGVQTAFDKLNRKGIVATPFEQDTTDETGETPEQYKVPLAAARSAGLPALAVTSKTKVIRVVKDPKTEAQVLEAVK